MGGGGNLKGIAGDVFDPVQNALKGVPIIGPALGAGQEQPYVTIPGVERPDEMADSSRITGLSSMINRLYGNQASATKDSYAAQALEQNKLIDKQMNDMITNLTTGQQGEQLMRKFNQLGLLDSGAFDQGLAEQFTPIQQQAQQAVLQQGLSKYGDLRDILGQQTQSNIGLNTAGTQRAFENEDWYRNAQLQRALAQAGANLSVNTGNQQSATDLFGSLVGGGSRIAAAGK